MHTDVDASGGRSHGHTWATTRLLRLILHGDAAHSGGTSDSRSPGNIGPSVHNCAHTTHIPWSNGPRKAVSGSALRAGRDPPPAILAERWNGPLYMAILLHAAARTLRASRFLICSRESGRGRR